MTTAGMLSNRGVYVATFTMAVLWEHTIVCQNYFADGCSAGYLGPNVRYLSHERTVRAKIRGERPGPFALTRYETPKRMTQRTDSLPDTTIAITRAFDAGREQVWGAWTKPGLFAQWFGPGFPAPADYTSMDVEPGGAWESTMVLSKDGATTKRFWGEYKEVTAPERLVLTFTDDPSGYSDVTVTLTEDEDTGATEMQFTQVGPLPEEHLEAATKGWNSFFDQLGELVRQA